MKLNVCLLTIFILQYSPFPVAFATSQKNNSVISISGKVIKSNSTTAIPLAHIIIKGSNRGVICDSLGVFHLQIKYSDTLQISAIGYNSKEWSIPCSFKENNTGLFYIPMKEKNYLLDQVTVHGLGTWNDFKYNFLKLKLKNKISINKQILKELAPYNTKEPNIVPPEYRPKIEHFSIIHALIAPTDFLYCKLNRKERSKSKITKLIRHEGDMVRLMKLYNKHIVIESTGLSGENLLDFMVYCSDKISINKTSTEYNVRLQIIANYKKYVSLHKKP